ncbi:hypothetical protein RF11_02683 [Thelohanellus kitauei]|uniref:Uncharacterized protein n=1 Tax=Thelohanellus kitauei TaxID=669202 RepID=A0A0C2IJ71_THEKT|nr:hypothetical protein RF11_02683 [Thelohanellus kitauei]
MEIGTVEAASTLDVLSRPKPTTAGNLDPSPTPLPTLGTNYEINVQTTSNSCPNLTRGNFLETSQNRNLEIDTQYTSTMPLSFMKINGTFNMNKVLLKILKLLRDSAWVKMASILEPGNC